METRQRLAKSGTTSLVKECVATAERQCWLDVVRVARVEHGRELRALTGCRNCHHLCGKLRVGEFLLPCPHLSDVVHQLCDAENGAARTEHKVRVLCAEARTTQCRGDLCGNPCVHCLQGVWKAEILTITTVLSDQSVVPVAAIEQRVELHE